MMHGTAATGAVQPRDRKGKYAAKPAADPPPPAGMTLGPGDDTDTRRLVCGKRLADLLGRPQGITVMWEPPDRCGRCNRAVNGALVEITYADGEADVIHDGDMDGDIAGLVDEWAADACPEQAAKVAGLVWKTACATRPKAVKKWCECPSGPQTEANWHPPHMSGLGAGNWPNT